MLRAPILFLLAGLGPAAHAAGQADNCFEITPHKADGAAFCVTFASRFTLGGTAGELLMEVPASHFAGIGTGAAGGGCAARGMRLRLQDEDAATAETFFAVVRAAAQGGGPDCSVAPLVRVGPLATPTGTGRVAHDLTVPFAQPLALPCCSTFYVGVELPAAPRWPVDGLSLWVTYYNVVNGTGDDRDTPCPASAVNLCWTYHAATGACTQPTPRLAWIGMTVAAPVLNLGGADQSIPPSHRLHLAARGGVSYGAGGMYLCCDGSNQNEYGLYARLQHNAAAGGVGALFLGQRVCPGSPLGPLASGALYLSAAAPLVFVGAAPFVHEPADGGEYAKLVVLPPNSGACRTVLGLPLDFVGVAVDTGFAAHLSNRASAVFN